MKLSPRLEYIASFVKKDSYIADIGTDHAYIPIYLIRNSICSRVIATDVRTGPLLRAEKNIRLYGLKDRIDTRKGYGLSPVEKNEIDGAILAGMGGYLICDIIDNDKDKADKINYFIIQPMQAPEAVRFYLYENGYRICDEMLVKENDKIYQIMYAEHGEDKIDDEIYLEIGKKLISNKDPLLGELVESKIWSTNKVIDKIEDKNSDNASKRINECKVRLKKYEDVLKCL